VLVGFLEAAHARTAAEITGDERRKLITSTLVNYFGTQAAEQFGIVEQGLKGRGVHPVLLGVTLARARGPTRQGAPCWSAH
jgi:hypothetical protein